MSIVPVRGRICAIAVMAKAPRAGFCKTRLVPPLDAESAAAMSAAFLRDTTENILLAARTAPIQGYAAYAPAGLETLFDDHLAVNTPLLLADGSVVTEPGVQGFGRCLLHAIRSLLDAGFGAACVLNSDGPTLPTAVLARAAIELAQPGDRAVLGPAEDGGYYLLGLKQAHARLFEDVAWSTGDVAAQTRERAASIGLPVIELPPWYDVDDGQALRRLLASYDGPHDGGFRAPATRSCVERLGLRTEPGIEPGIAPRIAPRTAQ
jgi:uncharacterized protein